MTTPTNTGANLNSLLDTSKRWLLVVGGRLGASSGVPQPYTRTRWSPSVWDLVRYEAFRTQTREVFHAMEELREERRPALGFVADNLDDQQSWLAERVDGLTANLAMWRLGDLVASGMFKGIVSSASSGLFEGTLRQLGVAFRPLSAAEPTMPDGDEVPFLRVLDDRLFTDTDESRTHANAFAFRTIGKLIESVDGVLIVGCGPEADPLIDVIAGAIGDRQHVEVIWMDEPLGDEKRLSYETKPFQHRESVKAVATSSLQKFFESVGQARGVQPSPVVFAPEPEPESAFRKVLDRSFDIRPVLVYVPGFAAFGKLVDKIPPISTKAILSLAVLVLLIVGYFNYAVYREYHDQVDPVEKRVELAKQLLVDESFQGTIQAEAELDEAIAEMGRITMPDDGFLHFGAMHSSFTRHARDLNFGMEVTRDFIITPLLYLHRFEERLRSDPSITSLGSHPPIPVVETSGVDRALDEFMDPDNPRRIWWDHKSIVDYRLPHSIDDYRDQSHLVLYSPHAALLRVTMVKQMLADLEDGRMVFELDLIRSPDTPLDMQAFNVAKTIAGYVEERSSLFNADGLIDRLNEGHCSFYFTGIDSAGVPGSLARIAALQARFPECRTVIETHSELAQRRIVRYSEGYAFVDLSSFEWADALAYLREETSLSYTHEVLDNPHLRWSLAEPIMLSLLVQYHRDVGQPPRSLGQLYDFLLQNLLSHGEHGFAPKIKVLAAIAYEVVITGTGLSRELAVEVINSGVFAGRNYNSAQSMLEELVAEGVLIYHAGFSVDFADSAFRHLALAKYLDQLEEEERMGLLLETDDQVIVFYAGLHGNIDPLLEDMMDEYTAFDAQLRAHGGELQFINPYLPRLKKVAHAVQNGEVSPELASRVEDILFELVGHRRRVSRDAAHIALNSITTPGIRQWVQVGIDQNAPHDEDLLRFTAWSSDDIYVGTIERWLRRLGTAEDPRQAARFSNMGAKTLGNPTLTAVANAFMTLAQVGSPDSLQIVEQYATTPADPRFAPQTWAEVRTSAAAALLFVDKFDRISSILAEIEARPGDWEELLIKLYRLNTPEVANTLVKVLAATDIEPGDPYGDRTIRVKRTAAVALSFMDRDVAVPPLLAFLATPRSDSEIDYLPFAALSLGYRGDTRDVASVVANIRDLLDNHAGFFNLANQLTSEITLEYLELFTESLALFGNAEAFAFYQSLYTTEPWTRDHGTQFLNRLISGFRIAAAERFLVHRLICEHPPRETYRLIPALGRIGTSRARLLINKLVQMSLGGTDAAFVTDLCGEGFTLDASVMSDMEGALSAFVEALEEIGYERDLPRFSSWALSDDRSTRRAAIEALSNFTEPSAGRALMATAAAFSTEARVCIDAMRLQASPYNEQFLLDLLEINQAYGQSVIRALAHCGGPRSVPVMYGFQDHGDWGEEAARAAHMIVSRHIAGDLDDQTLLELIYPPPPPAPVVVPEGAAENPGLVTPP